jgi:adenine-specific DNA-methyltransferase
MEKNAEDGGNRRYILVQLPEPLDPNDANQSEAAKYLHKAGKPLNIAELTKERLRRAGKKIREKHGAAKVDTGFRVYKLATSNLKPWQPDAGDLEASILDAVDNVIPDRTEEDLLVELLLKTGIDLTLPEEKRTIAGRTVRALGGGTLMVCLGDVGADDAEALGQGMADWIDELEPVQTTIYFKDTGLGADGNRAATKANLAAILRQRLSDRIAKIASI